MFGKKRKSKVVSRVKTYTLNFTDGSTIETRIFHPRSVTRDEAFVTLTDVDGAERHVNMNHVMYIDVDEVE